MEITWLGHANFRLRGREGVVVTDPALWKGAAGRTTADLVTVSHAHPGHNQAALVGGQPRVISGPGEYEVKGIVVTGVQTYHDAEKGKKRGKNTAYVIDLDDLVVCHLGDLGHLLSNDHVDQMRNVDVLMVPVGGGATIDAAQAVEVISLIEPGSSSRCTTASATSTATSIRSKNSCARWASPTRRPNLARLSPARTCRTPRRSWCWSPAQRK